MKDKDRLTEDELLKKERKSASVTLAGRSKVEISLSPFEDELLDELVVEELDELLVKGIEEELPPLLLVSREEENSSEEELPDSLLDEELLVTIVHDERTRTKGK